VQVPLQLLQLGRAEDEEAPRDDVEQDDPGERERQPGGEPADPIDEALQGEADGEEEGPPRLPFRDRAAAFFFTSRT
jgi:hypothetical protein